MKMPEAKTSNRQKKINERRGGKSFLDRSKHLQRGTYMLILLLCLSWCDWYYTQDRDTS